MPAPRVRFSLLLLDDGEVLLDDVAVEHAFVAAGPPADGLPPVAARLLARRGRARGRLKVGTKNLFFDGDDWREPIVRVPVAAVAGARVAGRGAGELPAPPISAVAGEGNGGDGVRAELWTTRVLGGLGFDVRGGSGGGDAGVVVAPVVETGRRVSIRMLQPWRWGAAGQSEEESGRASRAGSRASVESAAAPPSTRVARGGGVAVGDDAHLAVRASCLSFQREGGADHAYVDAALDGTHCFYPLYSRASALHEQVAWLRRVAAIPGRRDRERALRAAVRAREDKVPFDIAWLDGGLDECTLLDRPCATISALSRAPGRVRVTGANVYLMPIHGGSGGFMTRIPLASLLSVRKMRHGVRDAAVEIGYDADGLDEDGGGSGATGKKGKATLMLAFKTRGAREEAVQIIQRQAAPRGLQTFGRAELDAALNKWRAGEMSNFEYLLFVNLAAGRSFNDLSQYPVFPWILADYTSDVLDLSALETFRDLSLPIGALEPRRRAFFEERYREMPPPRFHYGTHYSTPAYVINYLVRAAPGAMLRLQNGRFDAADRLFNSIGGAWAGVAASTTDMKELIPEFFAVDASETPSGVLPASAAPTEFLDNVQCLDLGTRQDGVRVDDVELPPWANGRADEFLANHRVALESIHVSSHIHKWIDLIFGVHARSPDACNVFYTDVAAGDALDGLDDVEDDGDRDGDAVTQLETVFLEFGRTPQQLFQHPHPPRFGTLVADGASTSEDILLLAPPLPAVGAVANETTDARSGDGGDCEEGGRRDARVSASAGHPRCEVEREMPGAGDAPVAGDDKSGEPPGSDDDGDADERRSDGDRSSIGRRSMSTVSVSERRLSVTLSPSCAFLSQLAVDALGAPVLSPVASGKPGAPASIVDVDVALTAKHGTRRLGLTAVTAWTDHYLRVYVDAKLRRSRHVDGLTALACGRDGLVFVGTGSGGLSLYNTGSGRSEVILPNAHDAPVSAICYSSDGQVLVTASEDATVQVWNVDPNSHVLALLRRYQELDAEDAVVALAVDLQGSRLYIACVTIVERVLAWSVDVSVPEAEVGSARPAFDLDVSVRPRGADRPHAAARRDGKGAGSTRSLGRICWVDGAPRKHMLAVVHHGGAGGPSTVALWKLNSKDMRAAEMALPRGGRATCVARGVAPGTLFVGGHGCIAEFDRTGLCLHHAELNDEGCRGPVTGLLLTPDATALLARVGSGQVVSWAPAAAVRK